MSKFLHNCRTDVSANKELTTKDGEQIFKTTKGTIIAREMNYDLGNTSKTRYLVATYLGSLYDPMGGYSNREAKLELQMKQTNKEAFVNYVRYVQTRNRLNLIAAERGFLNGN